MLVVFRTGRDTRCTPVQTRHGAVSSRERIRLHLQKPGPSFTAKKKQWCWYQNPGVCGTERKNRTSKYTQQKGTTLKLQTYYVKCVGQFIVSSLKYMYIFTYNNIHKFDVTKGFRLSNYVVYVKIWNNGFHTKSLRSVFLVSVQVYSKILFKSPFCLIAIYVSKLNNNLLEKQHRYVIMKWNQYMEVFCLL